MKKWLLSGLVLLLFINAQSVTASSADISVLVNGQEVVFTDGKPYWKGSEMMLPVRDLASGLGMKVSYEKAKNEVRLTSDKLTAVFKIGESQISINGKAHAFSSASATKQYRTYVPLSFFSKELGIKTVYDEKTKKLTISKIELNTEILAEQVIDLMNKGGYEQLWNDYFDQELQKAIPLPVLDATWKEVLKQTGEYKKSSHFHQAPSMMEEQWLFRFWDSSK